VSNTLAAPPGDRQGAITPNSMMRTRAASGAGALETLMYDPGTRQAPFVCEWRWD
jgi:hypothetical protein